MRIGLFSVAHPHILSYVGNLRAADIELVGVADHNAARGRGFAENYNVPWFDSYEALLSAHPNGVVVCAETVRHRSLIERAASAGVAVLCEKPLATTETDSGAIVKACTRMGVPLMTAFPMRFSAPMWRVRDLLADGALGEVYAVTGTNQAKRPMHSYNWFADPKLAGGGALMDHVVHLVDLLRWCFGVDVAEVYATANRIIHGELVTVETGALVFVTLENGVFATIDCSWSRPQAYPTWGGLALNIVAERGVVGVDAFKQRLTLYGDPDGVLWKGYGSDPYQGVIDEFVAAIREQREPIVTGEDGHAATVVALAAAESAQIGRPVSLIARRS